MLVHVFGEIKEVIVVNEKLTYATKYAIHRIKHVQCIVILLYTVEAHCKSNKTALCYTI